MSVQKPRKIRDRADAECCLDAVAGSRLALREWAHQHDVDARSLNMWRVLRDRRSPRVPPAVAPLRLVELVAPEPVAVPPLYRIRIGPFEVEVDGDFDAQVLARLLHVARTC